MKFHNNRNVKGTEKRTQEVAKGAGGQKGGQKRGKAANRMPGAFSLSANKMALANTITSSILKVSFQGVLKSYVVKEILKAIIVHTCGR